MLRMLQVKDSSLSYHIQSNRGAHNDEKMKRNY